MEWDCSGDQAPQARLPPGGIKQVVATPKDAPASKTVKILLAFLRKRGQAEIARIGPLVKTATQNM